MNGSQRLKETHNIISFSYSQSRLTQTQAFPWHPLKVVDKRQIQMCSTVSPCLQHDIWACITVTSLFVLTVPGQCPQCLPGAQNHFLEKLACKLLGWWPVRTRGFPEGSTELLPSHIAALASLSPLGPAPPCHCVCKQELLLGVFLLEPGAPPASEWEQNAFQYPHFTSLLTWVLLLKPGAPPASKWEQKALQYPHFTSVLTCLSVAVLGII